MSEHISTVVRFPVEVDNPSIILLNEKCLQCGMCKNICKNYI